MPHSAEPYARNAERLSAKQVHKFQMEEAPKAEDTPGAVQLPTDEGKKRQRRTPGKEASVKRRRVPSCDR